MSNKFWLLWQEIISDLQQQKIFWLLLILNIISALAIIQTSYLTRTLAVEQDKLMQQADELDIEWRHLLLEQRTFAEHSRIEAIAKQQLGMHRPQAVNEIVINR